MSNKTMRHELPRRFQSRRDGAGINTVPSNNKLFALDRKVEKREAQDEEIEGGWKEVIRKPSTANEESEEEELADTSDEDDEEAELKKVFKEYRKKEKKKKKKNHTCMKQKKERRSEWGQTRTLRKRNWRTHLKRDEAKEPGRTRRRKVSDRRS